VNLGIVTGQPPLHGDMPVAATWKRSGQCTAPAAPVVDAMGGGLH